MDIGLAYDADLKRAKRPILKGPPPKVPVKSFVKSSVALQLRVRISAARKRMDTISYLTGRTREVFGDAGGEIPHPKRDI